MRSQVAAHKSTMICCLGRWRWQQRWSAEQVLLHFAKQKSEKLLGGHAPPFPPPSRYAPAVSWYIILWSFLTGTFFALDKKSPSMHNFPDFGYSNESSPIPHAIFETTRSGFIQILHHCSVSWKITPLHFFRSKPYTLDKNSPSKLHCRTFLSDWVKIH